MLKIYTKAKTLLATRDQGVTAAEYGLILAGIAVVVGIAAIVLGDAISALFNDLAGKIAPAE